jgi:hypothetical protein
VTRILERPFYLADVHASPIVSGLVALTNWPHPQDQNVFEAVVGVALLVSISAEILEQFVKAFPENC